MVNAAGQEDEVAGQKERRLSMSKEIPTMRDMLIGKRVVEVRNMTAAEKLSEHWEYAERDVTVMVMEDGVVVYPLLLFKAVGEKVGSVPAHLGGMNINNRELYVF